MWSAARRAEAGELGKSWCPGERGRTQAPLNTEASPGGQGHRPWRKENSASAAGECGHLCVRL